MLLVLALRASLRDTMASRESVRKWFHRFSKNILCGEEV
jgi:hypothetical protein